MKSLLRRVHVTPSFVISVLALVVALTGTAYAAGVLPSNSVGTPQLKNNAVTTAKVKKGTLVASDFKPGSLPRGATGATGPQGPEGAVGDAGSIKGFVTVNPNGTIYRSGGSLAPPTVTHPATGVYCIVGEGWAEQGGAFSAALIGSGDGGSVAVNPYFWGSACNGTGFYMAVHTFNAAGAAADRYFVFSKL